MKPIRNFWKTTCLTSLLIFTSTFAEAQGVERPTIKTGDRWKYETRDGYTNLVTAETERIITTVSDTQIEATENGSKATFSREMNAIETPEFKYEPTPSVLKFPFDIGAKWSGEGKVLVKGSGITARNQYDVKVVGQESITVRAGTFDTYKLVMDGYITTNTSRAFTRTYWYSPKARGFVKVVNDDRRNPWVIEMLEMKLEP